MPASTSEPGSLALAAVVARLEAERHLPVPRAARVVAVDVDDLALLLHHLSQARAAPRRGRELSPAAAAACSRLETVVRCHATAPGPPW